MISLHHTHLMASDIDATIAFWRDPFGAEIVFDDELVQRLKAAGVSVTDVRELPEASYAMAQGPDGLLLELFRPHPGRVAGALASTGYFATVS